MRKKTITIAIAIVGKVITIGRAMPRKLCTKTDTKKEAKRSRAITLAIANLEEQ